MDLLIPSLGLAALGMVSTGRRRRVGPGTTSATGIVAPTAVPPPKIIVRPRVRAGTVMTNWGLNGVEARPGASGVIRADFLVPVQRFVMEMDSGGIVSSYPIQAATLHVRNLPSGRMSKIDVLKDATGVLIWKLNDAVLPTCNPTQGRADSCAASGLPAEFFGQFCGFHAIDSAGQLLPRVIIDW
jgi:hypothetical protein